jgi:eukaryotic-like serine/threonine-protein kinase
MQLDLGQQIGDYRLVREIGRGAMGVVFEARGPQGDAVALKVLVPSPLLPEAERAALHARFLRESRALAAVDHPNVVRIYEAGEADGRLYLAMELVKGENLRELLARSGALPPARAVALVEQLLHALEAAHHAGIVHRDVKPENVLVLADGSVKLMDFGVAWMEQEATLTRTGGILGSPAYMSPEQILGQPVDRRSDLFSTAVTLYQLLTDRLPFQGSGLMELAHNVAYSDPSPLPPEIPYPLSRAIMRGLRKSAGARYGTASEFAGVIRAAVTTRAAPGAARVVLPSVPNPTAATSGEVTLPDAAAIPVDRCDRHPRQPALGHCGACGRALCRHCTHQQRPPYFCFLHTPITLFGISTVRLEVAAAAVAFLLLLLCLGPLGYAALWK